MPILCWVCDTLTCSVLGEGFTGVGLPGLSLGPSIILGWNATIVKISTTVWIAVGAVLNFWVAAPLLYYSGTITESNGDPHRLYGSSSGLAVWPGGLDLYSKSGERYSVANADCEKLSNESSCLSYSINYTQPCRYVLITTHIFALRFHFRPFMSIFPSCFSFFHLSFHSSLSWKSKRFS